MSNGQVKILISAGHTNNPQSDRGAAGNGFIEGVETVKIRDAVADDLRSRGFVVIEDGADGVNDPLKKAIALAKTADIAVEFHFNAGPATAKGVEVLSKPKNRKFSQAIARAIGVSLNSPLRGDLGWKSDSSGQHHRLGFCEAGGVIVEVAFISNKADMAAYTANFKAMCESIATAISSAAASTGQATREPGADGSSSAAEPTGSPSDPTEQPSIHVVAAGDTLWKLASIYQISVSELKHKNGLTSDKIKVGQVLKVR